MNILLPKGVELDKINDSSIMITTKKKKLIFSVGLFIVCWGIGFWIFGLITNSFNDLKILYEYLHV